MILDSVVTGSKENTRAWRKSDTTWGLGLFGTAIGAGVLFFPIRAGYGGLIPILIMLVLAYPIAFIATGRWPDYVFLAAIHRQILPRPLKNILAKWVG